VVAPMGFLSWRAEIVAWLLPANLAALPLVVLVDRDARRSRSSLYMLRLAWLIGIASSCLELFATDVSFIAWIGQARIILPMVGTTCLFVGLWLHARIVAYVCSEPPPPDYVPALDQLSTGWKWILYTILRDPERKFRVPEYESEVVPGQAAKNGAADEEETVTPKRKRRAPAKRTTKPRTRTKAVVEEEPEEEPIEDQVESGYQDEAEDSSSGYESPADEKEVESEDWNEEPEVETPPARGHRDNYQTSSVSRYPDPRHQEEPDSDESDDDDDDDQPTLRRDSGVSSDQLKGLSKRQKRELRRQAREQQRNQRR